MNTNRLFVANLPFSATEADLKPIFQKIGLVAKVEIIKDQRGHSRGYGFVEMSNQTEAQNAIEKLNLYPLNVDGAERNLFVTLAK